MIGPIRISIRYRWWLNPYLYGVSLMAYALQVELDMDKVGRMVKRGIKVKVAPVAFGVEA